jgi:hyperosmotically inducible protein
MNRKQISLLAATAAWVLAANGALAANAGNMTQRPADDHLTTEVKAVLARQTATAEIPVSVTTINGVVTLTGWVGTVNQMARAVVGAAGVKGVVRVRNRLRMIL